MNLFPSVGIIFLFLKREGRKFSIADQIIHATPDPIPNSEAKMYRDGLVVWWETASESPELADYSFAKFYNALRAFAPVKDFHEVFENFENFFGFRMFYLCGDE